jgi:hypothetical protein
VREGYVVISDVVEEVDLILFQHQSRSYRVNRSVSPPLIEETTILVKSTEVVDVSWGAQPIKVANLEIRPLEPL